MDYKHSLICGDNITVLRKLSSNYNGKITCAYLDPPYNGGEKYKFYNDSDNHTSWLNYMRDLLSIIKPLLTKDGSIWISIDDNEMHYLKVLCDEVFGRINFITTLVWQQRNTRENRRIFSHNHEYILVYCINKSSFKKKRNLLPSNETVNGRYQNPDNDPRGEWQSVSANVQDGHAVESQFYTIVAPNGKKHNPPKGRCWVYNEERMKNEILSNNIWFGTKGNGVPRIKKFKKDAKIGLVPETLWLSAFAGTNKDAKTHLQKLNIYDKELFDTPKPEQLLRRIIEIATDENDYILDPFAGSGTSLSVAHKLNRQYIGIERNPISCEFINKRMNLVISGEQGGISKELNWLGGGLFQFIKPK